MKKGNLYKLIGVAPLVIALGACSSMSSNEHHFKGQPEHGKHAVYNPKASQINVQLGMGYLRTKQNQRAKEKLLLALKQDPKSPVANDAMAYFQEVTGNYAQAENYYKNAIDLASSKGAPLNNYGTFLCRQGKYQESEKYFMQAVEDHNYIDTADAYENAGLCAMEGKDFAKAEKYLQKALEQQPNRPTAHIELSRINYRNKNYSKAQTYLNAFLKESKPTAESTLLGYQISAKLKQTKNARRFAAALEKNFANTPEFKRYQAEKRVS